MSVGCINMLILVTIVCWYEPRGLVFVGALIPLDYFNTAAAIFTVLFHSFLSLVIITNLFVLGSMSLVYLFYVTILLALELPLGRLKYMTLNTLRNPTNLRYFYRSLQVLNLSAMSVFGVILFIAHGYFIFAPTYTNYLLIRFWSQLQVYTKCVMVLCSPFALIFWSAILHGGGHIFIEGRKVISSWKRYEKWKSRGERRAMIQFARSCTPIVLCFGKRFVIKKVTFLKYHKTVGRALFKALLAARK